MNELDNELKRLNDDLVELLADLETPIHRDTVQMRASHLWMKYDTENKTRANLAKKLRKIFKKYAITQTIN